MTATSSLFPVATGLMLLAVGACSTTDRAYAPEPTGPPTSPTAAERAASAPTSSPAPGTLTGRTTASSDFDASASQDRPYNSRDASYNSPQGMNGERLDEGTVLVQLGGTGNNDRDFDIGGGQVSGSVGYMVTDRLELAVRQAFGFSISNVANDNWSGATRGSLDYYFVDSDIAPYAGLSIGMVYGDEQDEDLVLGPEGGVKFFVKRDAYLDLRLQYLFLMDARDSFSDAFSDGSFFWDLGLGLTF